MAHFSYSFCMSMLHSLWQAGLLALIYLFSEKLFQHKTSPLQKRNWLFVLLTTQLSLFVITFLIYFSAIQNTVGETLFGKTVTDILPVSVVSSITPWLFGVYLVAIMYKMTKAFYEWLHFKKLHHAGLQKPSIDLKLFTLLKADHFGIKRKLTLWFSTTINAPVTFGYFKPIIILPVALVNNISLQQAETLILHELTHIKANDYILNWALIVIENIFFFNPFILALCKKVRLEREKYCDSRVMAFEYSPIVYAETLLKAQYIQQYIPQYQLAAVTGKKQLLQRISFFTNKKNFTYQKKNNFAFPLVSLLLLCVFITAICFQYKITVATKSAVMEIAAAPTSITPAALETTNEIATPSFVNNIIENLTDEKLEKIEKEVAKQQPIIEKQLKKLQPFITSVQDNAEAFAQQSNGNNFITPISFKENFAGFPTKQIIVKEEQSGSKDAVVKVYTVSFINGQWVVVPDWILAAKEIPDSLITKQLIDSSLINVQQ